MKKRAFFTALVVILIVLFVILIVSAFLYFVLSPRPEKTGGTNASVKNITEVNNTVENSKCIKNNFKFAFLLLGREESDITQEKIEKLNDIKTKFSSAFLEATSNLATADVSYPVATIIDNGSLMNPEQTEFYRDGIINKFFENNLDNFDFIIAFPAFETSPTIEDFMSTNYKVYGIGQDDDVKVQKERGYPYIQVHTKNLLGLAYMGVGLENPSSISGLLHEVGHQWCCDVGDDFAKGQNNAKLEIIQQGMHFYRGLQSDSETGCPMDSDNWVPNGDGSYRRENKEGIQKYHPFQLYFMGLLNETNYDFNKKFQVYDAGIVGVDFNDQKAYPYKEVSINDIIAVEGERRCG